MQVGGPRWRTQREWIEKLNLQVCVDLTRVSAVCLELTLIHAQAHHNAQVHSDEFVVEHFVSLDKMNTLVQELLVVEVRHSPSLVSPLPACTIT